VEKALPRVSVIIPTYNRAHMLREAVDSVLCQTFKDYEIIIIDGFSTDDTEAVVNSYHDRRIKYYKNQNNGIASINRNFGIEKSRGEYIAFLDDDDLWLPEKLEKQVKLLDSNKKLGLVYSDCFIINANGTIRKKSYLTGRPLLRGASLTKLLRFNFIPTLTVVIRKKVLEKVGVFDPSRKFCEDYDLWLRISQFYSIDHVNQPLAKYRINRESLTYRSLPLVYIQDFKIVDEWLKKNPALKKAFCGRFQAQRYWLFPRGAVGHILRQRTFKSIKESASLIFLMLSRLFS
jgi:cellulose synthase/poly-beta-1,6-N-acetylglucosamine synthase-like glycosyltransferase